VTNLFSVDLDGALEHIRQSPADVGTLDMIALRPSLGTRRVVEVGELDAVVGLVGDSWSTRRRVDPDAQLNLMNARMAALLAPDDHGRALAGDQLYVDIDFTLANLPAGTRLQIGDAVIEITAKPHAGCKKFSRYFGPEMTRFVNSVEGKRLRLRGVCARVVQGGAIRRGDVVTKL
jgi:hypothetical protein